MFQLSTKRCTKCERELPVSSFSKNRNKKDGLKCWCKECVKAHGVAYREANKDKLNTKGRAYREANQDKINTQKATYHAANRDRDNAKMRAYFRTPIGFTYKLWYSLNRRTINGKYKNRKSKSCRRYLAKGIELRITWDELYRFVLLHWDFIQAVWDSGESADLHRPDNNGHYSLDNIEFLPHSEHLKLHGLKNKKAS